MRLYKQIVICGFRDVIDQAKLMEKPLAVLSIEHKDASFDCGKAELPKEEIAHKVLCFGDIIDNYEGRSATIEQVQEGLDFIATHRTTHSMIIHCYAGACRSTAFGLAELVQRLGRDSEAKAVKELLEMRPFAAPNLRVIRLAEKVLGIRRNKILNAMCANPKMVENLERAIERWAPIADFTLTKKQATQLNISWKDLRDYQQHMRKQREGK
jgi:predicted protein tyrosine phosphatase